MTWTPGYEAAFTVTERCEDGDVRTALEALLREGLVPDDTLDPAAERRWWHAQCVECRGQRTVMAPVLRDLSDGPLGEPTGEPLTLIKQLVRCPRCGDPAAYLYDAPRFVIEANLWASVGPAVLLRAEALARSIRPGVVVWRVNMGDWLRRGYLPGAPMQAGGVVEAHAVELRVNDRPRWPEECPYPSREVRAAWGAMRALAAIRVHPVALDSAGITLLLDADGRMDADSTDAATRRA